MVILIFLGVLVNEIKKENPQEPCKQKLRMTRVEAGEAPAHALLPGASPVCQGGG
jgi:hypothetical protein